MNKYKNSKIDLQQKTGWLVKGMIKENEQKKKTKKKKKKKKKKTKQRLEIQPGKKGRKHRFRSPGEKIPVYFLVHKKETDTWSKERAEWCHTGDCLRGLLD